MSCIFCTIYVSQKQNIVYENTSAFVILDRYPITKGHLLVIPKAHHSYLHEYENKELAGILQTIRYICKTLGLTSYNILQNNKNYQSVHHVHFHIIPCIDEQNKLTINWKTMSMEDDEYAKLVEKHKTMINN